MFLSNWPKDITMDKWRSCACLICVEVESLLCSWGDLMSTVHQVRLQKDGAHVRGDMSRRLLVRCESAECPWAVPTGEPGSLPLPFPWPSRFKNIIARPQWAGANAHAKYRGPRLFCEDNCGCGCCVDEQDKLDQELGICSTVPKPPLLMCVLCMHVVACLLSHACTVHGLPCAFRWQTPRCQAGHSGVHVAQDLRGEMPRWLKCRLSKCGHCGWRNKYPSCNTIKTMRQRVSFRALDSARCYIEWMCNGRVGDPPSRKTDAKVDQLALVSAPAEVSGTVTHVYAIKNNYRMMAIRCF